MFPLHSQSYPGLGRGSEPHLPSSSRASTFTIWGHFSQGLGFPAPGFCLLGYSRAQWLLSLQYVHWSFSRGFLSLFGWSLSSLLSLTTVAKILCKLLSFAFLFSFSFHLLPFIFSVPSPPLSPCYGRLSQQPALNPSMTYPVAPLATEAFS